MGELTHARTHTHAYTYQAVVYKSKFAAADHAAQAQCRAVKLLGQRRLVEALRLGVAVTRARR